MLACSHDGVRRVESEQGRDNTHTSPQRQGRRPSCQTESHSMLPFPPRSCCLCEGSLRCSPRQAQRFDSIRTERTAHTPWERHGRSGERSEPRERTGHTAIREPQRQRLSHTHSDASKDSAASAKAQRQTEKKLPKQRKNRMAQKTRIFWSTITRQPIDMEQRQQHSCIFLNLIYRAMIGSKSRGHRNALLSRRLSSRRSHKPTSTQATRTRAVNNPFSLAPAMRRLVFAVVLLVSVAASSFSPPSSSLLVVEAAVARVCPPGVPTAFVSTHTTHECSSTVVRGRRRAWLLLSAWSWRSSRVDSLKLTSSTLFRMRLV
jgi:hypothetical protein